LLEYVPNHIRLQLRPERCEGEPPALDIDLALWLELKRIQRGVPQRFRSPVAERRLARFLARVAARLRTESRGLLRLAVRDVESGRTHELSASLDQNRYRL
jgi:hypothetical protein